MEQRALNTLYGIETLHQIQNCAKHKNVSDTETLYTNCRHFFTNTQFTPWSIPTTEQLYVAPNTEQLEHIYNITHVPIPNTNNILHTNYRTIVLLLYNKYKTMGKTTHILYFIPNTEKTHFTKPNTEHCSTIARTYAKYRTLNAARYRQNTAASKYVHISAGICTSQLQLSVDSVLYPDYVSVV